MSNNDAKNRKETGGAGRAVPIVLLALAVFIGICFITKNDTGMLGYAISGFLLGLFSVGAYAIPFLLASHALFFSSDVKNKRLVSRTVFSVLLLLAISVLAHAIANWGTDVSLLPLEPGSFYSDGAVSVGGGFIGGLLAYLLMKFLGQIGVIILSVAFFAIYLTYFFSKSKALKEVGRIIIVAILTVFAGVEQLFKKLFGSLKRSGDNKKSKKDQKINEELAYDDFFDVDNGIARLEVSGLGIVESRSKAAMEANPTLQEKVYHSQGKILYEDHGIQEDEPGAADSRSESTVADSFEILDDDIIFEAEAEPTASEQVYSDPFAYDSADSVFTSSFDPYAFASAEKLANKPSSRTAESGYSTRKENPTVKESLDDVSPEQIERMRREEEFERRKGAMLEEQRQRDAERRAMQETARKNVEFRVQDNETVAPTGADDERVSVTIEKFGTSLYNEPETVTKDSGSVYSGVFSPVEKTAAQQNFAEPVKIEFKDYSVPESSGDGLVFEFDTQDTLEVERTMLKEEPVAEEEKDAEAAPGYQPPSAESVVQTLFEDLDDDEDEIAAPASIAPEEDSFGSDEEIPPEEQNPFITEARSRFAMFNNEPEEAQDEEPEIEPVIEDAAVIFEEDDEPEETHADYVVEDEIVSEADDDDEPPFDFIDTTGSVRAIPTQKEKKPEPPKKKEPDFSKYKIPPIDLLGLDPVRNEDEISTEINENTRILIETLQSFNVTASIKGVDRGPRITRYEVVPARGVKVNQVTHLFDDIKLALAAEGVRMEAPIPGRSAIGFEIPNKHPKNVRLRELIECDEFQSSTSTTYACIGKDVAGNPIFGDIAKFPHALVAGATGMGKSVCINSILISMLYKARPDEVRFILIDPKKVEFKVYSGIPHLLVPVVTEAKQAAGALMWAVEEMERRYDLIEQFNLRNIQAYNEKVANDPSLGKPLSKIVIVIDELNDLMMQVRDPAEDLIMRIAQKARAAGIHLIIGTQRPDVKVITGTIKANIGTRISCKVTSVVDSRTILEMAGAEKLLNKGDMLYKPTDRTEPVRVQGCFVSDGEVESIMEYIKQFANGEQYDEEVIAEINKAAATCGKDKKGSQDVDDDGDEETGLYRDQQFLDAVELAIRSGKVSTSLLQRKLQIGFGKAARFIDGMESIGIVSEPNGQKPRDVLISMDEWREKLSRVDIG